ncbi:MAG: threo-3-hydroxy-L-aspartate ammonia-lyase [Pantoea sp.]|uniref:threo-3-hydroxy-L-aspartate ammonia-lyase n=1 Tax=Pantoea sp. TaxID=69393 RepID=UPI0039E69240
MTEFTLPTYDDVAAATQRIQPYINPRPVMTSRSLNEALEAEVFFQCENFQRMGAFKFRGALNALLQFTPEQRKAGVVAFSSGNHAQGVALAAKLLSIPATIVMPLDAPAAKLAATRGYGAQVVTYDRYSEDREQIGRDLAEKHGLTLIPPYDHPHVIAGQGTATQALLAQTGPLDVLLTPLGGGGLLAGSALAARHLSPGITIYGVEPAAGNDGQQSLRAGKIIRIETPKTIADGAQTQYLGRYTFPLIQSLVDDILTASDEQLIAEMRFFAERMKMVVEPTGCLGLAAVRADKARFRGKRIGIVISGGNVDISRFGTLLAN